MKTKLLFATLVIFLSTTLQAQVWDETSDGDLSDDGAAPSGVFNFEIGSNIIIAEQRGLPRDVDFFAFTIPDGSQLQEIVVDNYVSSDDVAFIGIDSGATTDVDFMNASPGDLLGGASYGTASIGNNILPIMGNLGGAEGFIPPLPAGTYTIWLNQTSEITSSEVTLNFVVDETLSLDDNQFTQNEITIFPNPANNIVSVRSTQTIQEINLFDIVGKKVKSSKNTASLDISNLTSGVYLASVITEDGTITKKVIKQ